MNHIINRIHTFQTEEFATNFLRAVIRAGYAARRAGVQEDEAGNVYYLVQVD